jgi:cytochrome c551/c552
LRAIFFGSSTNSPAPTTVESGATKANLNCQKKKEEEEEEDKLVNFRTKGPTKAKTIPMVKQLETLDVTSKFFIKILLKS